MLVKAQNMKHLIKGIIFGSIILPVAGMIYQFVAWFVYGFSESIDTLFSSLIYGAIIGALGIPYGLIILIIYGLPLFLLSRYFVEFRCFGFASWFAVVICAILPWIYIDGFMNRDIHHFFEFTWYSFEFTWYSLVSGLVFWFFARKAVNNSYRK